MKIKPSSIDVAQKKFICAASLLNSKQATRSLLCIPLSEHHYGLPVQIDDGVVRVGKAFRVLSNNAYDPGNGGMRFHTKGMIETIRAQVTGISWEYAVTNILMDDPRNLGGRKLERLCRGWVEL